jgi:hypothetical protein
METGRYKATRKAYTDRTKEQKRQYDRTYKYGISYDALMQLKHDQWGLCAICRLPFKNDKDMHVDHCHVTNVVRGLLCFHCNSGLGHFRDNSQRLQSALEYLAKRINVLFPT